MLEEIVAVAVLGMFKNLLFFSSCFQNKENHLRLCSVASEYPFSIS